MQSFVVLTRGVILDAIFQKGSFCSDVFPYTLYRKYIKFATPLSYLGNGYEKRKIQKEMAGTTREGTLEGARARVEGP